MRHSLELEGERMLIHLDVQIVTKLNMWFDQDFCKETQPEFVQELFTVRGVTKIALKPYIVSVYKGRVFSWKEIIAPSMQIIKKHYDQMRAAEGQSFRLRIPID